MDERFNAVATAAHDVLKWASQLDHCARWGFTAQGESAGKIVEQLVDALARLNKVHSEEITRSFVRTLKNENPVSGGGCKGNYYVDLVGNIAKDRVCVILMEVDNQRIKPVFLQVPIRIEASEVAKLWNDIAPSIQERPEVDIKWIGHRVERECELASIEAATTQPSSKVASVIVADEQSTSPTRAGGFQHGAVSHEELFREAIRQLRAADELDDDPQSSPIPFAEAFWNRLCRACHELGIPEPILCEQLPSDVANGPKWRIRVMNPEGGQPYMLRWRDGWNQWASLDERRKFRRRGIEALERVIAVTNAGSNRDATKQCVGEPAKNRTIATKPLVFDCAPGEVPTVRGESVLGWESGRMPADESLEAIDEWLFESMRATQAGATWAKNGAPWLADAAYLVNDAYRYFDHWCKGQHLPPLPSKTKGELGAVEAANALRELRLWFDEVKRITSIREDTAWKESVPAAHYQQTQAAFALYREFCPSFLPAIERLAGLPSNGVMPSDSHEANVAFNAAWEAVRKGGTEETAKIRKQAHEEWKALTGLRPLGDRDAWMEAAVTAGIGNPESLPLKEIETRIRRWVRAKFANHHVPTLQINPSAEFDTSNQVSVEPAIARRFITVIEDIIARVPNAGESWDVTLLKPVFVVANRLADELGKESALPLVEVEYAPSCTALILKYQNRYGTVTETLVWRREKIQEGPLADCPNTRYCIDQKAIDEFVMTLREWQRWAQTRIDEHVETSAPLPISNVAANVATQSNGEPATSSTTVDDDATRRIARLKDLEPALRLAYLSNEYAERMVGRKLTGNEAYDLIRDEGFDEKALHANPDLAELEGYRLPVDAGTWRSQLSQARTQLGENRYQRRRRATSGRSIVKSDEIEYRGDD